MAEIRRKNESADYITGRLKNPFRRCPAPQTFFRRPLCRPAAAACLPPSLSAMQNGTAEAV